MLITALPNDILEFPINILLTCKRWGDLIMSKYSLFRIQNWGLITNEPEVVLKIVN